MPAIVIRAYGKFFEAQLEDGRVLLATVRGLLRRERRRTDLVAVGDRVWVTDVGEGEGQIEAVEPRVRSLARRARLTEDTEQIILANPDQALFLFAVREPSPHLRMLDRFLILAESRFLPAAIGVNKMDLDGPVEGGKPSLARSLFGPYEALYPVFYLGAKSGRGLDDLRAFLSARSPRSPARPASANRACSTRSTPEGCATWGPSRTRPARAATRRRRPCSGGSPPRRRRSSPTRRASGRSRSRAWPSKTSMVLPRVPPPPRPLLLPGLHPSPRTRLRGPRSPGGGTHLAAAV
jgi:hypothetical protein